MQSYRMVSSDGREIEIVDEGGDSIFPYQQISQLAKDRGISHYTIKMSESQNE